MTSENQNQNDYVVIIIIFQCPSPSIMYTHYAEVYVCTSRSKVYKEHLE